MSNKKEKIIYDGQNRCIRCDRPLSDPDALYGWRCAQIVGYDNYLRTVSLLDESTIYGYNKYVARYLKVEPKAVKIINYVMAIWGHLLR